MNEIYLDLNEVRNPITGKGYVEYSLRQNSHDFTEELDSPEELGADSWAEVNNLELFARVIGDSKDEYNEPLWDFLNDMKYDKKTIIINDTSYTYERLKEYWDLLPSDDEEEENG